MSRLTLPRRIAALALVPLVVATDGWAQPYPVERVNVADDLSEATDDSGNAAISPEGQFVGFTSFAGNLVPDDTNGTNDVFLRDRATATVERISVASDGTEGNGDSGGSSGGGYLVTKLGVSADGAFVAFPSDASNLVAGDTNDSQDIFVRDRAAGETTRISVANNGEQVAGGHGQQVSISDNGQFVSYDSISAFLVDSDGNGQRDVFVHDRGTGTNTLVSVATSGAQGDAMSRYADLSADGQIVAFQSFAGNLVADDTNGVGDIFVRDLAAGTTKRVSVASDGSQSDDISEAAAISADGRYVAFFSQATNLVAGDTNMVQDVFVHDRQTGVTERVNVSDGGGQANDASNSSGDEIGISGDGQYVIFPSLATNLVPGDINGTADVFVYDRAAAQISRVSVSEDGIGGDGPSEEPVISDDGQVVAFDSRAANLVPDDGGWFRDVFAIELVRPLERYEYVAKIVCGIQGREDALQLVRGAFATTVNIHNPGRADVTFFKKLALSIPPGFQEPGEIMPISEDTLAYDEALATDCEDLRKRLFTQGFPGGFIEGYVVIQSPAPLEVDTVYTAGSLDERGRAGSVTSIDVERVSERDRAEGCDLVVEKTAEPASFDIDGIGQFSFFAILYTISVTNNCDQPATGVSLTDHLRTSTQGTVFFVPLPDPVEVLPAGMLTPGAVMVEPDNTLSAEVTGAIAQLGPNDVGSFRYWVLGVTYPIGVPQSVDLINTAEVTSDLFEESLANNTAETITPLF